MKSLAIQTAAPSDIDEIMTIIADLSNWLKSKGIHQWSHPYPREKLEFDVHAQHVYVIRDGGMIAATVTLSDQRDSYWSDFAGDAIYLHRLAVRRSHAGKDLGSRIISWARAEVANRPVPLLRLDCDSQNNRLRDFYTSLGFHFCGVRRVSEYNMEFALFEKPVRSGSERRRGP